MNVLVGSVLMMGSVICGSVGAGWVVVTGVDSVGCSGMGSVET